MKQYASAAVEDALFAALKELKNKVNLLANKSQTVGSFWDPAYENSPFEQELTLTQLASLDPLTLVKKKSFTEAKMIALTDAVKKAIKSGELKVIEISSSISNTSATFIKTGKECSVEETLKINGIFAAVSLLNSQHNFYSFYQDLLQQLGDKSFISLFTNSAKNKISAEEKHIVRDLSLQFLNEVDLHWRTALTGVGAGFQTLINPYLIKPDPQTFDVLLFITAPIFLTLEAKPLKIKNKVITNHFSLHPETAPALYKALRPKSGFKSREDFDEILSGAFSLCDLGAIYSVLE